jgi:uncharacterized Rmd1/YagE family protein
LADVSPHRVAVHAVLLGERLNTDPAERETLSTTPLCFRQGDGYVVAFRHGVAVAVGLAEAEEKEAFARLAEGVPPHSPVEEERLVIEIDPGAEERLAGAGRLRLKELTAPDVLVVADVLAKTVALARYERDIASVFDTIEPIATKLAADGRVPAYRSSLLRLVGEALLAQHRVSGRIAFAEKPEILWEHPELERFYARLEDEYEIIERGTLLNGKVAVIASAAQSFTDLVDTQRSSRLELMIVIFVLAELVIAAVTFFRP